MDYIIALIPPIGTGILFYVVIRAFVNADRNERAAIQRLDDEDSSQDSSATRQV